MNEISVIKGVHGYIDESGNAHLNLEDVSRGLGFTQAKNGTDYVRWETVSRYLKEFSQLDGKTYSIEQNKIIDEDCLPEFIPENIFYKLCFKANNEVARKFQDVVTDEILPAIRKTGEYSVKDRAGTNDQLKQKRLEIMERNSRTNQAKLMLKFIESGALSEESAELVCIEATQLMINKVLPYRPKTEKLYTATEIGDETGFSSTWVGKIAGQYGLKTDEFSVVVLDTKKNSNGQVDTYRYNEKGRTRLIELLKDSANWPKYKQERLKKERAAN